MTSFGIGAQMPVSGGTSRCVVFEAGPPLSGSGGKPSHFRLEINLKMPRLSEHRASSPVSPPPPLWHRPSYSKICGDVPGHKDISGEPMSQGSLGAPQVLTRPPPRVLVWGNPVINIEGPIIGQWQGWIKVGAEGL